MAQAKKVVEQAETRLTSKELQDAEDAYCSIENALDIIGGKWSFLILRELYEGPQRFNELRRRLHGISPKSLTDALRHLEANGVVERRVFATVPVTVEYSVTNKGHAFHAVLKAMKKWGKEWA
ncbi:helix-turn-helix domain-containing protein [Alicyclobacillus sp. SO9]|uniref:winged helix-turn-helix transcriptional regulator n=1 Tax=Alicyclobacillus sp. SO9 TaxID=2665646 RepID=UPI0018E80DC2|nr:helix-turn-helix domain-containing protein [Alicyclobacillus sp. SO9]QQE77876.1 helix-turn-helix transcriptional regulator [Alicyclobacillus sp. SO9]